MSAEKLRRLLDEVIFYKIFLVDSYCQRRLDATRYKFLLMGMGKVFRERLSASNLNTLEDKLSACSKIPFDEFTALRLTERAGFGAENFFDEIYTNFKFELMIELADLQITIEKTAEFLNAPPSEQEAFLRRIEKKYARKEIPWRKVLWLVVILLIGWEVFISDKPPEQNRPTQTVNRPVDKPKQIERIAKIGVTTGYVYDHPILNDDGLCEFTIDNTRNDMPVYVRIWDVDTRRPVRAFTIAQGDKFTAYNLSPGTYEVRYKELYENDAPPYGSKSEPTTLEQIETYSGTSYSIVELTLYKVHGGNTTTTRIDASDV